MCGAMRIMSGVGLRKFFFFFLIQWPMIFIHKRVVEAYLVKRKNDRKYLFRKLSN
jgi:hypothetical protein